MLKFQLSALAALVAVALLPARAHANDFPTQARVEYVLQCTKDYGGQTLKNVYGCVCMIDHIAEAMSFDEYEEATTFSNLRTVPGERSGLFRENPRGRELTQTVQEVRTDAARACLMTKPDAESP